MVTDKGARAAGRIERDGLPPPIQGAVALRPNPRHEHILDVELRGVEALRSYDAVECHLVLYPYSRQITAEEFGIYPFQEYSADVLSHQRSAYAEIVRSTPELFGLLLAAIIAAVFYRLAPESLLSVESVVSAVGAYAVGKELWDDVERLLVRATRRWRLSVREPYYAYELERDTTLALYSRLAKRLRYESEALIPARMDYVKQSNSKTVRLYFDARDLEWVGGDDAHLCSIHVEPRLLDEFRGRGYLVGVKLALSQRRMGAVRSFECFQSISRGQLGCLDESGTWRPGAAFFRRTWQMGRIKWYRASGILPAAGMISQDKGIEDGSSCAFLSETYG